MNEVFVKLANMSVAAGWLILAVLVLRLVLKRAPRWITCLLWALVAVRLVCPISLQSPVSAYQVATPAAVQDSGGVEYFQYVHADGDKPSIQLDVEAIRPAEITPAQQDTAADTSHTVTRYLPPYVTIWLAVGGALLLYALASTVRLRYRVREAMCLRENIWLCDAVTSPFLLGILRPRIYLPSGMDEGQMDYVLAHEQAHLRRCDHIWKPLGYLLLAIHWFNPLVWVAYWLFCRDIETACDERVVRSLTTEEKKAYSNALLACSQGRRMVLACPVAFGEEGVKGRIKAVLNYKKPAFWVIAAAVIACVAVAACFLTDPVSGGKKGTLTFVEKENIVSTWRADFTVETRDAALDANIYAEVWRAGQCRTTQLLRMGRDTNELSVQMEQPERNEQMRLTFSLWAATDAYGGYGDLSDDLKEMPKDTAFAAYTDGEKRQVAAGDDIVLLAMAADLGGGLPQFDCRRLEKQPAIARDADYMIVVRAAFAASDTTSDESSPAQDTDSAREDLLPEFRLPVAVGIDGVEDTGSVQSLDALINDHRWVTPVTARRTGAAPSITLHAASGDTLYMESGMDALLEVTADGTTVGYASDMSGDAIIDALSGWAWQMKKNIARSKEAIPDVETLLARFPDGGFRWDIYLDNGNDSAALVKQLWAYVQSNTLTAAQCRSLLLNCDGLDGAYTEGYTAALVAIYQKQQDAYMQAWRGLTYAQQTAVPADPDGVLPQARTIRWSYDSSALSCPYMTVNGSGTVFYMEIPDDLAARIEQRVAENVKLGGFEPPQFTNGWGSTLISWVAEKPEVHLLFKEDYSEFYSLCRGYGGVWGLSVEGNAVQADAEVRELLAMIRSLTGWETESGREAFSGLTSAERIYNSEQERLSIIGSLTGGEAENEWEAFSGLTSAELIYNGETFYTVSDADHMARLQNLLQNGTQADSAAKTPPECVQLRLTRSDGTTFSVLVAPDTPRIYLPPFYYYRYNDDEPTGTQPLLDALGLSAWPDEVMSGDCGAWLTALQNELTPMPQAGQSGGASLTFPLPEQTVTDAVNAVGLPLTIAADETQSYTEGHIAYTLRNGGEDVYPWCFVSSSVYDGGKRLLQVSYLEAPGEDTAFRCEDWQKPITLAGMLWGGFDDDDQLYRQLSALPLPEEATSTGFTLRTDVKDGFCTVRYNVSEVQSKPIYKSVAICFYTSQQEYLQMRKEAMQQREKSVVTAQEQLNGN